MLNVDRLKQLCEGYEDMYRAFLALGLFLDPSRIKQKTEEFIEQSNLEEKGSSEPAEGARPTYRIIMRIALARGLPDLLRKYAEMEDRFFQDKLYWPFIDRAEKATEIAKKFYQTSLS